MHNSQQDRKDKQRLLSEVLCRTPSIDSIIDAKKDMKDVETQRNAAEKEYYGGREANSEKKPSAGNRHNRDSNITLRESSSFYDADYWLYRGNIYSKKKQTDLALDCYRQGLQLVFLDFAPENRTEIMWNCCTT